MQKIAHWSFRHRRIVVVAWLLALVATSVISGIVGPTFSNDFNLPDTQSTRALNLLTSVAPQQTGDTEQIVWETSGGTPVTDPQVEARITPMLRRVVALPHVSGVGSPYSAAGVQQVSPDTSVAFANVTFDQRSQNITIPQAKTFVDTATAPSGSGLTVAVSGQIAQQANQPSVGGMGLGIITAGIVLFLVFGSVVFGSFILGGERVIKEFGVGLAAAIFVDAVLIRTTLVPSLMLLMGKANWRFPSWLDRWVPHIHVEPEEHAEAELEPAGIP
jgi:RND superfamily putative drug exporter